MEYILIILAIFGATTLGFLVSQLIVERIVESRRKAVLNEYFKRRESEEKV